jgi:hypothetical protein
MSTAFQILKNAVDWEKYKETHQTSWHVASVNWGPGPSLYPCMAVSTIIRVENRVITCYVYVNDALALLEASPNAVITRSGPDEVPVAKAEGPSQSDYNKHASAMLMALVQELVDMKITNEERFERIVTEKLALVDQVAAEKKGTDKLVMNRLHPAEEPE